MKFPQIETTVHHIWILRPRRIFSSNSSKSLLDRWGDGDRRHHPWKGAPAISGDRLPHGSASRRARILRSTPEHSVMHSEFRPASALLPTAVGGVVLERRLRWRDARPESVREPKLSVGDGSAQGISPASPLFLSPCCSDPGSMFLDRNL